MTCVAVAVVILSLGAGNAPAATSSTAKVRQATLVERRHTERDWAGVVGPRDIRAQCRADGSRFVCRGAVYYAWLEGETTRTWACWIDYVVPRGHKLDVEPGAEVTLGCVPPR